MTLWTLDSCGFDETNQNCQIFINDTTQVLTIVRRCPVHQTINPGDLHQENLRGPSNALDHILQNAPAALFDTSPQGVRSFKGGITANWNWTGTPPNRVLNVTVTGFTPTTQQRTAINTAINNRFGAGNVIVTFG
jgi:hypothetical protein